MEQQQVAGSHRTAFVPWVPESAAVGQFDLVVAAVYDRRLYSYGFPALTERRYSKPTHYRKLGGLDFRLL